jgi:heptosyltransferase-1
MKILVVRLSSLGDILHLFPAVSDLRRCFPDAEIHWLVEPAFAQMVSWHSAVDKVIEVPLRSHKKNWWKVPRLLSGLRRRLRAEKYDLVLDAQGLLKSVLLARLAGVDIYGFDKDSARESLASKFYRKTASVAPGLHVIEKNRQLVARLFGADISHPADFGLDFFRRQQISVDIPDAFKALTEKPCVVLLHGTTWNSKYWPESSWLELAHLLTQQGVLCLLPWGNEEEHLRALRIADATQAHVLPRLSLTELIIVLLHTQGFVSVESGIGHLATVLDIPGLMLHGPTDPGYSGIIGKYCLHITSGLECSPCFKRNCPITDPQADTPPCQRKMTAQLVFEHCLERFSDIKENTEADCRQAAKIQPV